MWETGLIRQILIGNNASIIFAPDCLLLSFLSTYPATTTSTPHRIVASLRQH